MHRVFGESFHHYNVHIQNCVEIVNNWGGSFANRFELNSVLCAFQNPHVRMAWNTYMHVECQNLIVYKAQCTRKREEAVFKTKYCNSYLYTNFV